MDAVTRDFQSIGEALGSLDEDDFETIEEELSVKPPGTIKQQYFNRAWIPFASDGGGNYLGVDLDPGENGTMGQVINFGRDDMEMFVIAPNIAGFLKVLRQLVEEGSYQRRNLVGDLRTHLYG